MKEVSQVLRVPIEVHGLTIRSHRITFSRHQNSSSLVSEQSFLSQLAVFHCDVTRLGQSGQFDVT
jgi:hypothetical protein